MYKTSELNIETLKRMSSAIRVLAAEAVQKANSGHPGMPMGIADVATILFSKYLNIDVKKPDWPDRDRFVLSGLIEIDLFCQLVMGQCSYTL